MHQTRRRSVRDHDRRCHLLDEASAIRSTSRPQSFPIIPPLAVRHPGRPIARESVQQFKLSRRQSPETPVRCLDQVLEPGRCPAALALQDRRDGPSSDRGTGSAFVVGVLVTCRAADPRQALRALRNRHLSRSAPSTKNWAGTVILELEDFGELPGGHRGCRHRTSVVQSAARAVRASIRMTPALPNGVLLRAEVERVADDLHVRSRVSGVQSNGSFSRSGSARASTPDDVSCSSGCLPTRPSRPMMKTRRRFCGNP